MVSVLLKCYKYKEYICLFYLLGLAGIYLLMDNTELAISEYRKVLQLASKFTVEEKEGKLVIGKNTSHIL